MVVALQQPEGQEAAKMTSPILIAVDLGPDAEAVAAAGLAIADRLSSPAELVYVDPEAPVAL